MQRKSLADQHHISQKGTSNVAEMFLQGKLAFDPDDNFTIGTNFTAFAINTLGQTEYENLCDINHVDNLLGNFYKDGWKPKDGTFADPKYGILQGHHYSCKKHHQKPLGTYRQCDCLPICVGCGCTQAIKINTSPFTNSMAAADIKARKCGYGFMTFEPVLFCPRHYTGHDYVQVGAINNHCKIPCDKEKCKVGKFVPKVLATKILRDKIYAYSKILKHDPSEAATQLKRIAKNNLTIETVRWHLIARTYRMHQKGYDLDNPTAGQYDPMSTGTSLYQKTVDHHKPFTEEEGEDMERLIAMAFQGQ